MDDALVEKVARAGDLIAAARLFAAAIDHMQDGYDWDGYDLQEACKQAGLTFERDYDPVTDEHMEADEGDTVWVPTEAGQRLLNIARSLGPRP